MLGPDVENGQLPQHVVPAGAWQMARSLGDYTLCGCTVAPGFDFSRFELAPKDFRLHDFTTRNDFSVNRRAQAIKKARQIRTFKKFRALSRRR